MPGAKDIQLVGRLTGSPGWHKSMLQDAVVDKSVLVGTRSFSGVTALRVCPAHGQSDIVLLMFENFTATDRWTKKPVHCVYQAMIVAIATRHADAVDIKFLVDGRKVWVALPHPAWVEYKKRTGKIITDSLAQEIAGHYLKTALEAGEGVGREMYSLTVEQTLAHLEAVVAEMQAQPA